MNGVIIVLIAAAVFFFVLEPFFYARKLPNRFITRKQVRKNELSVLKENLLDSIRELDLENATGMIPKEDYHKLRKAYISRLETINHELGGLVKPDRTNDIKKQIETDIKIHRKTTEIAVRDGNSLICPECSAANLPGSNFCSKCGEKLS